MCVLTGSHLSLHFCTLVGGESEQAVSLFCLFCVCVCVCVQVVVYKGATRDNGYMNLEAADLSVEAKVQRVRVTVVFNFLNRIKVCLSVCRFICLSVYDLHCVCQSLSLPVC